MVTKIIFIASVFSITTVAYQAVRVVPFLCKLHSVGLLARKDISQTHGYAEQGLYVVTAAIVRTRNQRRL